ncbi:uncharacterized protein PAC_15212 [Phialocephala subalpina]|uniref:MADS-box domain-containing protein n=1 Tax=Phialocephala subalpina TaxID=576137 RepID=A0A1L7XJT5_9HELO|nr:uncharacterized protein PAC_15212 [Phialocephala subalpina]
MARAARKRQYKLTTEERKKRQEKFRKRSRSLKNKVRQLAEQTDCYVAFIAIDKSGKCQSIRSSNDPSWPPSIDDMIDLYPSGDHAFLPKHGYSATPEGSVHSNMMNAGSDDETEGDTVNPPARAQRRGPATREVVGRWNRRSLGSESRQTRQRLPAGVPATRKRRYRPSSPSSDGDESEYEPPSSTARQRSEECIPVEALESRQTEDKHLRASLEGVLTLGSPSTMQDGEWERSTALQTGSGDEVVGPIGRGAEDAEVLEHGNGENAETMDWQMVDVPDSVPHADEPPPISAPVLKVDPMSIRSIVEGWNRIFQSG